MMKLNIESTTGISRSWYNMFVLVSHCYPPRAYKLVVLHRTSENGTGVRPLWQLHTYYLKDSVYAIEEFHKWTVRRSIGGYLRML